MRRPHPGRGVYAISVAADLAGMDPQRLRLYETRGLLEPDRTPGGTRRYSLDDLDRIRHIGELLTAGLNLAGVAMVLDLEEQNTHLRTTNQEHPMTSDHPHQASNESELVEHLVPEGDRLEQATPVDPSINQPPLPDQRTDWADEADQLEQHSTVDADEEDYPHQTSSDDEQ